MRFLQTLICGALVCLLFVLGAPAVRAQADIEAGGGSVQPAAEAQAPLQVAFGAYVLRVSGVSPQEGAFDVDMWVWFRWKTGDIRPDLTFEVTNGVVSSRSESDVMTDGDFKFASVRVQAHVFQDFNMNRFPLDNHVVEIKVEDAILDSTQLAFTADEGSALDPGVSVPGWTATLRPVTVAPYVYNTNYGYRSGPAASSYSRVNVAISLERFSVGPLFKRYWISGLAVVLAMMSLLINAKEASARIGMGLGSIFAASANVLNISRELPPTTAVTLAEQVNLIAVGVIFSCVFVSVFSIRRQRCGKDAASLRLDRTALFTIGVVYLALNAAVLGFDING